jgi:hypothetical protein
VLRDANKLATVFVEQLINGRGRGGERRGEENVTHAGENNTKGKI